MKPDLIELSNLKERYTDVKLSVNGASEYAVTGYNTAAFSDS
jgi:hypothetical protein